MVLAISLVIALGTGTYAALIGTSTWRTQSNDASFEALAFHDVRVTLTTGATVQEGRLAGLLRALPSAAAVAAAEERLAVPTLVEVGESLVSGRLVGSGSGAQPLTVNRVHIEEGAAPAAGQPAGVLEYKFASAVDAPPTGTVRLSGGAPLAYTGLGYPPDDFVVSGGGAGFFLADSGFASVYTSLPLSQQVSGATGQVNELVVGLAPDAEPTAIAGELSAALAAAEPPISATVTLGTEEISYRVLYEDIEQDEEFWTIIAMLMLIGATFAALNLISRVVEGERREIGIGMALGKPTWTLAVRPLLLGLEIAVVGVVLGLLIGWLLTIPLEGLFTSLLPLPVWETPLVLAPFVRAAAFGVLLPMVAVAWPVWRAVRVEPVDAIRVGHLAARGAGWSGLLRRVPMPGRSYWEMPLRNLLRTPRRTVLTALGVAMAITVTITVSGLIDSFSATIDEAEAEVTTTSPDRLSVRLDTYRPLNDPVLADVAALPGVAEVIPGLVVGARGANGDGGEPATWTFSWRSSTRRARHGSPP